MEHVCAYLLSFLSLLKKGFELYCHYLLGQEYGLGKNKFEFIIENKTVEVLG